MQVMNSNVVKLTRTSTTLLKRATRLGLFALGMGLTSQAFATSDIWLFDINTQGQLVTDSAKNITARPGYDNQPHFSRDGKGLFYTEMSTVFGLQQTDVIYYSFDDQSQTNITKTIETSEYSPTETSDPNLLSIIKVERDGTQRLWYVNKSTGQQSLLNRHIKPVGYHAWGEKGEIAMFILGEPMTLQLVDDKKDKQATTLDNNIGPSIRYSDELDLFTYSKEQDGRQMLWSFSVKDGTKQPQIALPNGSQYYTLFDQTQVITADQNSLVTWPLNSKASWRPFADLSPFCVNGITRIAVNKPKTKIAVVCNEPQ